MAKFISLKVVILLGVGLFCLGGSGLLLSMGKGEQGGLPPESGPLKALEEQVRGLEARLIGMENRLSETERGKEGEIDALKGQVRDLTFLVEDLAKRLERHEKRVDNRPEKKDNKANVAKQALSKRSPVSPRPSYHVVKSGETLYRISKKYNITERELIRLNGLKDKTRIFVGQKLLVSH